MLKRIARLFTIKTRFEAYLVTYAIAVGAIERGIHYMQNYPGNVGWLLFAACLGVPFIAGAKLLDSVKLEPEVKGSGPSIPKSWKVRPRRISRNRPRDSRSVRGLALPSSRRTD